MEGIHIANVWSKVIIFCKSFVSNYTGKETYNNGNLIGNWRTYTLF